MRKMNQFFQRGFSLLEIMVAMGLLGVVTLFGTQIISHSGKNADKNRSEVELAEFMNQLNRYLTDPAICQLNFQGKNVTSTAATFTNRFVLDSATPTPTILVSTNDNIGQSRSLRLKTFSTSRVGTTARLKLDLIFERNKNVAGIKEFKRSLELFMEINGSSVITKCIGFVGSVTDTADQLTCMKNSLDGGEGRDVFVRVPDPANPGKFICFRKSLQTDPACATNMFVNRLTYNSTDYQYKISCAGGSAATFVPNQCTAPNWFVGFSAGGVVNCQPFGVGIGEPFAGSHPASCTAGNNYIGFDIVGTGDDGIETICTATP